MVIGDEASERWRLLFVGAVAIFHKVDKTQLWARGEKEGFLWLPSSRFESIKGTMNGTGGAFPRKASSTRKLN